MNLSGIGNNFILYIALCSFLISILFNGTALGAERIQGNSKTNSGIKYIIVVVVEGLTEDAIQSGHMPNINKLGESGAIVRQVLPALPDKSGPVVATVLSGLEPARHGHMDTGDNFIPVTLVDKARSRSFKTLLFDGSGGSLEGMGKNFDHYRKDGFQGRDRIVMDYLLDQLGKQENLTLQVVLFSQLKGVIEQYGPGSKEYADAAADCDNQVGRLIHFLYQGSGIEKSLIVLTGASTSPPIILKGPGVKAGAVLPAAGLVDIAPTVAWLAGLEELQCTGLVLWNAFLPGDRFSEAELLERRVRDLSKNYMEAWKVITRAQEERIYAEKLQTHLSSEKTHVLKELDRRDRQIERLTGHIKLYKFAGMVLFILFAAFSFYQYRYLKKKYLLFS